MKFRTKLILFLYPKIKYLSRILMFISALIAITIIYAVYNDLSEKDMSTYCYAFFVANVVAANCLFSLGRSNVFLDRFPDAKDQLLIYRSGILFLTAAIIGLTMSGFTYLEVSPYFSRLSNDFLFKLTLICTSIYMSLGIILSIIAVVLFFIWGGKAFNMYSHELEKEIEK